MATRKIISEKTLNYIETLYLYADITDFPGLHGLSSDFHPVEKYKHAIHHYFAQMDTELKFLSKANGRDWYKTEHYRIGIMDYDKAKIANQKQVEIQYEWSHMIKQDKMLTNLLLPFGGTFSQYHIKRIDLTQIVKTPVDYLNNHNFITTYRTKNTISNNGLIETIYLGKRKTGNVFRMYNKTAEILATLENNTIKYEKVESFSSFFGNLDNLYTFELEFRRNYLRDTYNILTLNQLDEVYAVYNKIVSSIGIYEATEENIKLHSGRQQDRIEIVYHFDLPTTTSTPPRVTKKRYKPSYMYMLNNVKKTIDNYQRQVSTTFGEQYEMMKILVSKLFDGLEIEEVIFKQEQSLVNYEELYHSFQEKREGQTRFDSLFQESNIAFAPIMLQRSSDLF